MLKPRRALRPLTDPPEAPNFDEGAANTSRWLFSLRQKPGQLHEATLPGTAGRTLKEKLLPREATYSSLGKSLLRAGKFNDEKNPQACSDKDAYLEAPISSGSAGFSQATTPKEKQGMPPTQRAKPLAGVVSASPAAGHSGSPALGEPPQPLRPAF